MARKASFFVLVAALSTACLRGAVFFEEDFEGYTTDQELIEDDWQIVQENDPAEAEAAWTITNPGARVNPPTEDGTPSDGNFMISDSDFSQGANPTGSGMSHDLWSPPFNCAAATEVWLHFDCSAQLNNNGKCVFDVDVSTDDGATWTNVFRRVAPQRSEAEPFPTAENVDGFFGRLHLDITAQASGKSEVRIRWRHFEPNDDWWIAIDDILVDDVPPPQGGRYTLMAEESFSAGIPASWTVRSDVDPANSGNDTWNTNDPCGRSVSASGGNFSIFDGHGVGRLDEKFAILDSDCDPDPPEDEYLITPVIDCTKATRVFLHWKSEIVVTPDVQEVLVSLDGGETFLTPPIFSYAAGALLDPGEDPFYAERIMEVPEAAGESQVAFAFHYQSPGNQWWWAIDDVKVTAEGDLPVRTCANQDFRAVFDESTGSVTCTWKGLPGDEGYRVLRGDTQVGGDLGSDVREFTDSTPPAGGTDVVYKLQTIFGGTVDLECTYQVAKTYSCPKDLTCTVEQETRTVTLNWTPGLNLNSTGYEIRRNGEVVGTVGPGEATFSETAPDGFHSYEVSVIPGAGADPGQCDFFLSCRVLVTGPVLLFEDFEGYADDAEVEAAGWRIVQENNPVEVETAWTITNPGGRANPPTVDGRPSQGKFMISDSDHQTESNPTGSGMSHDLWSPIIDCSKAKAVWLHFDCSAQLNNNGKCVFDIDVSKDGGESWNNVFRRVAPQRNEAEPYPSMEEDNADGFFGRLDVDISSVAAGESEVRIRWRHFEPNWDWWIAIDNVVVDETPVEGGSTVLMPEEGFDDGIPDDWLVESLSGEGLSPWSTDDACQRSLLFTGGVFPDQFDGRGLHHFDDYYAIIDGNCAMADQDEILATPVIDCSQATRVFLHFKSAIVVNAASTQAVLLSLDGGETFDLENPILSYTAGGLFDESEDPFYGEYIFEIPQAAGQKQVSFAFYYKGAAGVGAELWWWAIDDVMVTAETTGGGEQFVRGDVNDDGNVNIADAISILSYLFAGAEPPSCVKSADTNDDSQVNIADAIFVLGYLFGGGPDPAAPFGECGTDPTEDALTCDSFPPCGG